MYTSLHTHKRKLYLNFGLFVLCPINSLFNDEIWFICKLFSNYNNASVQRAIAILFFNQYTLKNEQLLL